MWIVEFTRNLVLLRLRDRQRNLDAMEAGSLQTYMLVLEPVVFDSPQ
jgi:hypothetical protein